MHGSYKDICQKSKNSAAKSAGRKHTYGKTFSLQGFSRYEVVTETISQHEAIVAQPSKFAKAPWKDGQKQCKHCSAFLPPERFGKRSAICHTCVKIARIIPKEIKPRFDENGFSQARGDLQLLVALSHGHSPQKICELHGLAMSLVTGRIQQLRTAISAKNVTHLVATYFRRGFI